MAQDRFARVVDKLSKGLELTQADVEEVQNLEKLAKQSKKKRMLDQV
jgi:hypothetical protein